MLFFFTQRPIKPAELTLFSRPSYPKPVFGLNCDPKCILLRAAIYCCGRCAGVHRNRIGSLTCSCAREFRKSHQSLSITRPARITQRVGNTEGFEDDQFQTSRHGRNFINDDRDAGNCTGSRSRARLAGFLPEPGCRIPIKRDSERYGIGTQRLVCERASEADRGEALRQRSQDVTVPHCSRSARWCKSVPTGQQRRSNRPPLLLSPVIRCRIRPAQCSEPGKG